MKKNILKYYTCVFCLFANFMMFALPPGDDTAAGDLESVDAPAAPIDSYLFLLIIVGILFAVYTFRKEIQKA